MQVLVRFYAVKQQELLINKLCRLVEKAQANGIKNGIIVAADSPSAEQINSQLWDYKPDFFLSHCLETASEAEKNAAAWQIAVSPFYAQETPILINCALNTVNLDLPQNCQRIFEIFPKLDKQLIIARQRFSNYRKQYEIKPEFVEI